MTRLQVTHTHTLSLSHHTCIFFIHKHTRRVIFHTSFFATISISTTLTYAANLNINSLVYDMVPPHDTVLVSWTHSTGTPTHTPTTPESEDENDESESVTVFGGADEDEEAPIDSNERVPTDPIDTDPDVAVTHTDPRALETGDRLAITIQIRNPLEGEPLFYSCVFYSCAFYFYILFYLFLFLCVLFLHSISTQRMCRL
jgi:hypothetical protein